MDLKKVCTNCLKWGIDLLFPRHCAICDEIVTSMGTMVCSECEEKWEPLGDVVCMKCGKALQDEGSTYCYDCMNKKHEYTRGRTLYEYGMVKQSIYRFKYMGRAEYSEYYGYKLCQRFQRQIREWNPDAIIPVPLHKTRLKKRGYNQTELIAKVVGRYMKIPVETKWIIRSKKTVAQKELGSVSRQNNLKRAFKIVENDVKLETIVIIDDIYTTGSTIDSIALECKQNGVKKIYFLTLAIGSGMETGYVK